MTAPVVERCDPRERAEEILGLFNREGRSQFQAAFDRVYRPRAEQGLRSWIGTADGETVMHISVSPVRFRSGTRTLTAGIMGDLMVAEAQRDFWAPVRLLRTVVADLKRDGAIDFLLTTTTSEAESVFRAGGFKPYGLLRRFVAPLYRPWLGLAAVRGGLARTRAIEGQEPAPGRMQCLGLRGLWRPDANPDFYRTRFSRSEYMDAIWLDVQDRSGEVRGHALLSRHLSGNEIGLSDVLLSDSMDLASAAHAAARWALAKKFGKLVISALTESRATPELIRAGFVPRAIRSSMLALSMREAPPAEEIFLNGFPLSSW